MRPPEFTGGNCLIYQVGTTAVQHASMRPPEFTGGNCLIYQVGTTAVQHASMRPPEFTGGNRRNTALICSNRRSLQ